MNAVDTNILIYACDARDQAKQQRSLELIEGLTDSVLVWQVACEFIAATRKLSDQGFTPEDAWRRLDEFAVLMPIATPSPEALKFARQLHTRQGVSLWDSLLCAACVDIGVDTLYSEDVPGSAIAGLRVLNPFA